MTLENQGCHSVPVPKACVRISRMRNTTLYSLSGVMSQKTRDLTAPTFKSGYENQHYAKA